MGRHQPAVVVQALGQHNLSLPSDSDHRIEIDVISGASAGGMTVAILGQKLPYEPVNLRGTETNHTRGDTAVSTTSWAGKRLGKNFSTCSKRAVWDPTTCP